MIRWDFGVDDHEEECDEPVEDLGVVEVTVEPTHDLGRVGLGPNGVADLGGEARHQKRSGHPLADNVARRDGPAGPGFTIAGCRWGWIAT